MSIFNANHQSNPAEQRRSSEEYGMELAALSEVDASVAAVYNLLPQLQVVTEKAAPKIEVQPQVVRTPDIQTRYAGEVEELDKIRREQDALADIQSIHNENLGRAA